MLVFVVAVIAILVYGRVQGLHLEKINEPNPGVSGLAVLVSSTAFALAALGLAALSSEPIRARLRLRWPQLQYVLLFVLATPVIGGLSSVLDSVLFPEPTPYIQGLLEVMRATSGVPSIVLFISTIAIAPIGEELFFRGYVQTRFERRLPIVVAIAIPAVVFTLIHMNVQHMIGVFPFALWAGYAAWRTQSVLVVILCHAYNNAISVVGAQFTSPTTGVGLDDPSFVPLLVLAAASIVPLVLALRLPRVQPTWG